MLPLFRALVMSNFYAEAEIVGGGREPRLAIVGKWATLSVDFDQFLVKLS